MDDVDPEVVEVEPDTAELVDVVETVLVDVTTVPDANNWLAPNASIIETSSTVAPLMKISSAAHAIWNSEPNVCPAWFGTITTVNKSGAN